ncbi:glycerophosphodiester phosphodiesterase family protein [Staphylococcus pasteuri]|uniref:glycerophosphodiester phosphodiesterase n=1 Tax=Staphylococcus TaxID=1279 RepID=UPI0008A125BB|nr:MULTISPECIES: glycerophosphodiester phosphodiesterase family protein [Staphylococcus]RQX29301.1 glycerophosphodiester phosphodiesterase [Staphylococcus warneri]MCO0860902.1 glycerophosphodiester phosphodiesterase [Staphylococcus pasteuri]MCO5359668.1 glycerophosphodiester phosphodiesterase [Staphylococcus pasteuri]OFV05895.1 glycerophosphodiester phosphodiesterase [Staphylococcus sp. HMSC13A10]UXR68378.1 glycerophosphodiester phosphodiesterase [Staphylococcus pasteuri]
MTIERPNQSFKLIAHRGLPKDYPENTLIGYQHALDLPIDMLEIDLHYTKDKKLVVIHDDTIDRTSNGKGKVKDYTLAELRQFDFGSNHDGQPNHIPIPTFDEVLQLHSNSSKTLLIEIKKPSQYPGIETMIVDKLKEYKVPTKKVILQSFDFNSVKKLSDMKIEYELGVLISKKKYWYKLPNFKEIAQVANYVNPNFSLVNKHFMDKAHSEYLKVMPYTVNETKDANHLINLKVDGIITDIPDKL